MGAGRSLHKTAELTGIAHGTVANRSTEEGWQARARQEDTTPKVRPDAATWLAGIAKIEATLLAGPPTPPTDERLSPEALRQMSPEELAALNARRLDAG